MSINTVLIFLTSAASFVLAIFVYSKGNNKAPNITLSMLSLAMAFWTFGQGMGEIVASKDLVLLWTRINVAAAVLVPAFYLHFILSLIEKAKKQKFVLFSLYSAALIFLIFDLTPYFVKDVLPAAGYKFYPVAGRIYPIFAVYVLSVFVYAFINLSLSLKAAKGPQKRKLLYVFFASIIGYLGGVTAFFPIWGIAFPVVSHFALPLYIAITSYAIIKHNLVAVNVVIRESLIYSALTLSFAAFYALVVLLAERFLKQTGYFNETLLLIIVVAVSVAIFQPLKDWVQRIVDRIFFRGSYYYEKTINDLSEENKKLFNSLLRADKLGALGTMAAGMAHEIKNPLASIKGMAQILPENLNDQQFIKDFVELVPRQLDRINKIVEKLLRAGKTPTLEKKPIDINEILKEVLSLHSNTCQKQGIDVKEEYSSLPKIIADPEQLHQVFINLIQNAIHAMQKGGSLFVKTYSTGDRVAIEIKDTGHGIPPENMHQIFDPFFSLKEKGTGLGLFIAYRVIQEHGGGIDVESCNTGTKFKIWLYTKQRE